MATSLEPKPVLYSKRVQPAIPDRAFVPMQDPNEVDELVYSAPNASQPRICIAVSALQYRTSISHYCFLAMLPAHL
jgi:hypothetical protein